MNNLRDKELLILFGNHLRNLRKLNNYTLETLAYESEMEISQIYRIEKGKINPTLSTLNSLAAALKIPLCDLLTFKQ